MKCTLPKTMAGLLGLFAGLFVLTVTADDRGTGKFEPRTFPISNVKSYSYRSDVMDRNYDISIGFPHGYDDNPDKNYPALIVTDGNRVFPFAHGVSDGLGGEIDQPVIISVGAPFEEGGVAYVRRRVYEFSPPGWPMQDAFGRVVADTCEKQLHVKPQQCVGGAPKFLKFIVSELLPDLYKEYRIDPDDLGLFGLSAGGFFASWVIFQEDSPFKRYIISSPAMAYGDGEIFHQEERYAATHKDLPVAIYMSSGALEMDSHFLEGIGKIVSGQVHLGGVLRGRNYPGLTLYSEIHQGLGHVDGVSTTLARGLRLLYANKNVQ